jgi:hypothetical protein
MRWKAATARQLVDFLDTSPSLIFGLLAVNHQFASLPELRPASRPVVARIVRLAAKMVHVFLPTCAGHRISSEQVAAYPLL